MLGIYSVFTGGVSGTVTGPKLVFAEVIKSNESRVLISHNHLRGNLQPSDTDLKVTKLVEGGNIFDGSVLEHIIVICKGYSSFPDKNRQFQFLPVFINFFGKGCLS